MADFSNQAELNKRSELGRLAKRKPAKEKINTWVRKLTDQAVDSEVLLETLRAKILEEDKCAKVRFLGGINFIFINEQTRLILLRSSLTEDKVFVPDVADETALLEHQFYPKW